MGNINSSNNDRKDWYKFTTNSSGEVTIDLTGLSGDLDLYLFDSNEDLVNSSVEYETNDEHITQILDTNSTYYVKVSPNSTLLINRPMTVS